MPKPKKVETFTHFKTGYEIDIFLDGTQFIAETNGEKFKANNAAEVRKQVDDFLDHWLTMAWHPVIEVEIERSHGGYRDEIDKHSVEVGTSRYYVSRSPAGKVWWVDWDVDEKHRKAKMSPWANGYSRDDRIAKTICIPLGAPLKLEEGKMMIDYDDNLWDNLEGIKKMIGQLSKKLTDLCGTREGIKKLMKQSDIKLLSN